MLVRPVQLSKVFTYHSLIALCIIGLIYHFLATQDRLVLRIPGAVTTEQHGEIPKHIWYKLGPNGLSPEAKNWTNTCIENNPTYTAHFINDTSSDTYVRTAFASRPDIVSNYLALPVPIYKADFLRYLLLWDRGGIWSDLDVSCETPIDTWVPPEYKNNASLVVGWEFDQGWPGAIVRQFTSWTIMAKPRSPHMMQVIDDILATLREKTAEHKIGVEGASLEIMGDVVDFTGPRRLTRGVFKSLGKMLNRTVEVGEMQELLQPRLVGDVLVMPGRSFAASANRYKDEDEKVLPPKLVTHHYAGTWKNDKGGEKR